MELQLVGDVYSEAYARLTQECFRLVQESISEGTECAKWQIRAMVSKDTTLICTFQPGRKPSSGDDE